MNKPIFIHAENVDEKTMNQFTSCASCDFVKAAALMPDAHLGYVAPVGAVLITENYLVPAWVGYDIGCGVLAAKTNLSVEDIMPYKNAIYSAVESNVPMGLGERNGHNDISDQAKEAYEKILDRFRSGPHNHNIMQFFEDSAIRHIGSLGSGNHFIELSTDTENNVWLVVHSGSRGVGYKVAKKYMERSAKSDDYEETHPIHDESTLGKEYKNILQFGLQFAELNREEMVRKTAQAISQEIGKEVTWSIWTNKNHNHALEENGQYIHRKGATPAKKGEKGVIPANMKEGSYLVEGKGADTFLQSSSHGAGRIMSRSGAKSNIDIEDFKSTMDGVVGTVSEKTLDEAPQAYKDISRVLELQKESIEVKKHLKPLVNWKGT